MKRKTPGGIKVLRAVSLTLAIVSLLVVGTVVYSAYTDYRAVQAEFGGTGGQRPTVKATTQGTAEVVALDFAVENKGLYTLSVSLSCNSPPSDVACTPASVSVPAGQVGNLHFQMTISNYAQYLASGNRQINGTASIEMVPLVGLSIGVDLGSLVGGVSA